MMTTNQDDLFAGRCQAREPEITESVIRAIQRNVMVVAIEQTIPNPINTIAVIMAEFGFQIDKRNVFKAISHNLQLGVGERDRG